MENIVLVGFGGHGKSMVDVIERQKMYRVIGYTDLADRQAVYRYLGDDDVLRQVYREGTHNACICVGYLGKGKIREDIFNKLKMIGFNLPVIQDPSSVVSASAKISEGTFIGKMAVINIDAKVGKCSIINTGAIVEHETTVEDFAHVSVGAVLCGNVKVGKGAFVGANATVIQGRTVGDYEIIPAGATKR